MGVGRSSWSSSALKVPSDTMIIVFAGNRRVVHGELFEDDAPGGQEGEGAFGGG
jgi:hypothetical protein